MNTEPNPAAVRRATLWIDEQRRADPERNLRILVEEAARRFDLSPLDESLVWRTFRAPAH